MPFLGHFLDGTIPTFITLCWILMLVDCITNKSMQGSRKVWWVLIILFTQIIGAIIYFALGYSYLPVLLFKKVQQWFQPQSFTPPYTPQLHQPSWSQQWDSGKYRYQEGYRARDTAPAAHSAELAPYDTEYEQPQASYPTLPPQQQ